MQWCGTLALAGMAAALPALAGARRGQQMFEAEAAREVLEGEEVARAGEHARLPRRLHAGRDGLRPGERGTARAGAASPEVRLYPKEHALVDLVAAERLAGRRVLVCATHTGTRDITGRMEEFLSRHGFKIAVMKADAVPPERREAWVAKRVEEGVDVLVSHPRLVQTAMDLVQFPTL